MKNLTFAFQKAINMDQKKWTDEALLQALQSEDLALRDAACHYIYNDGHYRASVRSVLQKIYGDDRYFDDAFAAGLATLIQKSGTFDLQQRALRSAFVDFALREAKRLNRLDINSQKYQIHLAEWHQQTDARRDSKDILEEVLSYLSERCQTLLRLFISGLPMKQIAIDMGYSDENSTKMAKSDCKKKLKTFFKENPHKRPDFLYDGI